MKSMPQGKKAGNKKDVPGWISKLAWVLAAFMVALMLFMFWRKASAVLSASNLTQASAADGSSQVTTAPVDATLLPAVLPVLEPSPSMDAMLREANAHTVIPTRGRTEVEEYTIAKGDSIFGIANEFKIKPETILWANYGTLQDDPHMISIGMDLEIPAVDGIYYQWKEGDTLEKIAEKYKADVKEIIEYPGNRLDIADPEIEPGTYIMIPGGSRELKPWIVAVAYAPKSGVNKGISGPGGCELSAGGAYGTGYFIWPAGNHFLSGNDYWSGHLAIDIAAGDGAPVYASDSGVVVYAGTIGGGYGNMVMIDHNNGYHTLYAHLSSIMTRCGSSVSQGALIGLAGSTGNSTGAHLHFEIRQNGGFVNPWYVLP